MNETKKLSPKEFLASLASAFTAKVELSAALAASEAKVAELTGALEIATSSQAVANKAAAAATAAQTSAESVVTATAASLGAIATALGLPVGEIAADKVQAALNTRVDALATDKLAALGFPLSGLPPQAAADSHAGDDKTISHEAFRKLSPYEQKKFSLGGGKITSLQLTGPFADIAKN
jgi:hypothetical protein